MLRRLVGAALAASALVFLAAPGPVPSQERANCYVSIDSSETSYGIACDTSTMLANTAINLSGRRAVHGPDTWSGCQAWINAQGGAPPGPAKCYVSLDRTGTMYGYNCDSSIMGARTAISLGGGRVVYGPATLAQCRAWIAAETGTAPGGAAAAPGGCYISVAADGSDPSIICDGDVPLMPAIGVIIVAGRLVQYGPATRADCQAWAANQGMSLTTVTPATWGFDGIDVGGDPTRPDALDLISVIDLTGSMGDDIAEVKESAVQIVNDLKGRFSDTRIAIVGFRDWSDGGSMFEDYPFTADQSAFVANVNRLSVSGGGDTPEAVLEGLFRAIETTAIGAWRDGVEKQIILMGDAPPHSPIPQGPHRGETAAEVATAAYNVDPAVINAVLVGEEGTFDEEARTAFEDLARRTGGTSVEAASAAEVPARIRDTIRTLGSGPSRPAGGAGGGAVGPRRSSGPLLSWELGLLVLLGAGSLVLIGTIGYVLATRSSPSAVSASPAPSPAPPPVAHWLSVEVTYPDGGTKSGRLNVGERATVGRAADSDLRLHDPTVSSRHAQLALTSEGVVVTDLGSSAGTFVNGDRVSRAVVGPGDELRFGSTQVDLTGID